MKKVLLIEDDTILRENTAELLALSDYEVRTAADGEKGVQAAIDYLPDVIICDIMMPKLDGYGVLEELTKNHLTNGIPFIFLSAKTEHKDIRKGMELGADDYLTKPFLESELIGAIESRLAKMSILKNMAGQPENEEQFSEAKITTIDQFKNYIDDNGDVFSFRTGETIYRDGMYSSTIYLILEGIVKTHVLDEMGKELITGIYKPDDLFGFSSITRNMPRKESATAMENVKLIGLSEEKLKKVIEENHSLTMELLQLLSEGLSETKEQLLQMAYGSVRRKTALTLLKFAEKLEKDPKGNIHILRSDLASVAGMATETLIRALSSFKKEGLIDIDNRNIKILDPVKLSRVH
ncbi:response regulator [Maribacter algicola]|uniref:Response regulator n=1 Tax=Meishania litoralis TaxID=3434685 RepID=A0ACC7LGS5_9FLAO